MSPKKRPTKSASKPARKGSAGKSAQKKTASGRKAAKKTASKKSPARAASKKAPKKKVAPKKVAKKTSAKKNAGKKRVVKKAATKKGPAKKTVKKKSATKKSPPKKAAAKKPAKKLTTKKTTAKKLSGKTSSRSLKKAQAESLAKFRYMLLQLRARLMGDVNMMSKEALGAEGSVDNHAPLHPAEVGTHSFEQEFTLNLLSSDGDRLERVDSALEKISDGSYGTCDECGGRIPKARLEAIPDTPFCVKCASKLEG